MSKITEPLYFKIYLSTAHELLSKLELVHLLIRAREKNLSVNVTGLLLYKDGCFLQLIEGKKADVEAVYDIISNDPKHKDIYLLTEGEIAERYFPDWQMGFMNLEDPEYAELPGYSQFINKPFHNFGFHDDSNGCLKLFLLFRDGGNHQKPLSTTTRLI